MTVRRFGPDDAEAWRALRLRMLREAPTSFATAHADWADRPLADWRRLLAENRYVAAVDNGRPVGAMGLWPQTVASLRHRGTLIAVWLDPEFRGAGHASAMLREIEAIAEELGLVQIELHVNADNARAIRFYRREGFDPIGRIPRALRHDGRDHDELLMVRRLDA